MNKIKNQKLIVCIIDKNNADELMLHKNIWTFVIENNSQIIKNKSWHKLVVHDKNTKYNDMSLIKNDIETFNSDFNLFTNPKWLTNKHLEKYHSSLVIYITDENGFNIARNELNVLEIRAKTECFRH